MVLIYSHHVLIIISERDMFDYSQGEPPENYLTVLRALEVRFLPFSLSAVIFHILYKRFRTHTFCAS